MTDEQRPLDLFRNMTTPEARIWAARAILTALDTDGHKDIMGIIADATMGTDTSTSEFLISLIVISAEVTDGQVSRADLVEIRDGAKLRPVVLRSVPGPEDL
jgi:hypothetical protein